MNKCPVCESDKNRLVESAIATARVNLNIDNNVNYYCCHQCGCLYLSPMPEFCILESEYIGDDFDEQELESTTTKYTLPKSSLLNYLPINRNFRHILNEYIQKETDSNSKILEIGYGSGELIEELLQKNYDGYGIELSKKAVFTMNKKYPGKFVYGDFNQYQPDHKYQVVYCNQVMEHITNPEPFIAQIKNLLQSGGSFIFMTPNAASIDFKIFNKSWFGLWYPQHVILHTPKSIQILMEKLGLEVAEIKTISSPGTSWTLSTRRYISNLFKSPMGNVTKIERALFTIPGVISALAGMGSELVVKVKK